MKGLRYTVFQAFKPERWTWKYLVFSETPMTERGHYSGSPRRRQSGNTRCSRRHEWQSVYFDGKLAGALAFALANFPKT